jgi:hypothetical protein
MRCTKKISKIQPKVSCGHCAEHLAGFVPELCYLLLHDGFWPKPLFLVIIKHPCITCITPVPALVD